MFSKEDWWKKSSKWKLKLVLSTLKLVLSTLVYMAFKHSISFATDLAPNFGCNQFRITPDIVSKLLCASIWSCCVVLLESEQRPFLGQVVDTDLLLCTGFDLEHAVLFLCHIFAQRRMNDRKIEQSYGSCLGRQQLLADSMEISFHMKNKSD